MFYLLGLSIAVIALLIYSLSTDRGSNTVHARQQSKRRHQAASQQAQQNSDNNSVVVKN